jgi:Zinc finger, ZZ type
VHLDANSNVPCFVTRALREYVHIGIGCDCCGAYPIRGKRFKCLDCPEAVGFDLCEACHRGSLVSYGRFNQRHVAGGLQ